MTINPHAQEPPAGTPERPREADLSAPGNRSGTGGERGTDGRFRPGFSGNPSGRPKGLGRELRELASQAAPAALQKAIAHIEHEDPHVSLAAIRIVLDRSLGKVALPLVTLDEGAGDEGEIDTDALTKRLVFILARAKAELDDQEI